MLFCIEGIDGAGKTIQAGLLESKLKKEGIDAVLTKEPTDGYVGMLLRKALSGEIKLDNMTVQLLFTADRNEHVTAFKKEIESLSKVVITDRYYPSTIAYGSAMGLRLEYIKMLNSIFPKPNALFILDISPELSAQRIRSRGNTKEITEDIGFLSKVRAAYKANFPDSIIIDASRSINEISEEIFRKSMEIIHR